MEDIAPKLYQAILKTFKANFKPDELQKKLKTGNVNYIDADSYADLVGDALAKAFRKNAVNLPDDRMYFNIANRVIRDAMNLNYDLVANYTAEVQKALNRASGLRIKALKADLDESKVKNLIEVVSNSDDYQSVAPTVEQAMTSFARSVVANTLKTNVHFHHKLGMSPKIVRKLGPSTGKKGSTVQCSFCLERVGTFEYNKDTIDKDIFRRHANCHCTLTYYPGDGKRQDSWSKVWRDVDRDGKMEERKAYTSSKFNTSSDERIAHYLSRKSIKEAKAIEKVITTDLKEIEKVLGSKLEGLDYRFKSEESLARKIISDSKEKNVSLKVADSLITDKLRYTYVNNEEMFTGNYFKTVHLLKQKGYQVVRVKNTFKDGAIYKGVNTLVKNSDDFVFEIQYHTPKSIEIKENGLHVLYEKQRGLDKTKDKKEWDTLEKNMIELSDSIKNPKNVGRIK